MREALCWCSFLGFLLCCIAADIPGCNFFDTVNLANSLKFPNGSYNYEDLIIPPTLTGEYDYEMQFNGNSRSVPSHTRGCVCKLRPCIRLCCHRSRVIKDNKCSAHTLNELSYNMTLDITHKHIFEDFVVQEELPLPCNIHYPLNRIEYSTDHWTLFENGTLLRQYDMRYLSKQDYCLQPRKSGKQKGYNHILVPYNCVIEPDMTMEYVKATSVLFMAITISVYLWLPQFQSLTGKCCNLYFICLAATFLLNLFSNFNVFDSNISCSINGYAGYFAAMATFLWLSVISFHVWTRFAVRHFQEIQRSRRSNFLNYNLIVWSTAGTLTLAVFLVDRLVPFFSTSDKTLPMLPAVGVFSCWISTEGWSGMLYFYSPLTLLILFNITMFVMTIHHIYVSEKIKPRSFNGIEEHQVSKHRAKYGAYLHLFIIMGCSWLLEIVAFICKIENVFKPLIVVNDVINCSQGIIIFFVTFCNRSMLRVIRERTHPDSKPAEPSKFSDVEYGTCSLTRDCHLMQEIN
ncbi:probable G-protein coupled receptor Mth-like 11 [Drosophila subobscura]|uniref:probable G-protein coupled receptor Mth-like 11 n=1 Tax=Drosophila subobscura TaxID=7241 RepID=UPI00155AF435|nr:probable G-protein coupled receptor Mth-like 11 [Drosophila subobscura]